MTVARLSQLPVEALRTNLAVKASVSQLPVEVLRINTGTVIRTSQIAVEVLRPNAASASIADITLGVLTLAATGIIASPITGSTSSTLGALTVSGTGTLVGPVVGSSSSTLGALTVSATGSITIPPPVYSAPLIPEIRPPAGIPVFALAGHTVTPKPSYSDIEMRTGQARRRRVCTSAPRVVSVGWVLESAQMAAIDEWYEDTLLAGERQFSAQVKGIGLVGGTEGLLWYTARWIEPYSAEALHLGRWRVTGTLLISGEGQEADPYSPEMLIEYGAAVRTTASLIVSPRLAVEYGAAFERSFLLAVEYGAEVEGEVESGS